MHATHLPLARLAIQCYDDDTCRLDHGLEYAVYECPCNELLGYVIAVQGSDIDPRDWLRNLLAFRRKDREIGPAPWGFHRASKRLADHLEVNELRQVPESYSIYVTGHSAGAGIGHLVAERLAARGYKIAEFVGLASPRTGRRELRVPATLYDHAGDPVCRVPWWWKPAIEPVRLPDMSALMFQHAGDYYVEALEQLDKVRNRSRRGVMTP